MARARDTIDSRVFEIEQYVEQLQQPHVSGPVDRGVFIIYTSILINVIQGLEDRLESKGEVTEQQEQILTDLEEINNALRDELAYVTDQRDWFESAMRDWRRMYHQETRTAFPSGDRADNDVTLLDANPHERYLAVDVSGTTFEFHSLEAAVGFGELVAVYPPWLDIEPEAEND